MTALPYAGDYVRRHDPDRFLLTLLAAPDLRPDLWALYAFYNEIAKTREVVTDTTLGLVRLQWWRDGLAALAASKPAPEHPVFEGLSTAIKRHSLGTEKLEALIFAREFDLEDKLPSNIEGTAHYADYTATPLLDLACRITAPDYKGDLSGVAVGSALVGILRATPVHLTQQRCYLPADRLPRIENHYLGKDLTDLQPVARDVALLAKDKLLNLPVGLPRIARAQRKLALMYLQQIEKADFDIFSPKLAKPILLKPLRLLF